MRTDDMVREALADLAPTAPADSSALAGMHRAIGRRRRRQQVARIAAAVTFVALAVGAGAVVLRSEGDPADVSTDPDDITSTTTPSSTTTTSTIEGGPVERTSFGPVSFQLPEGWEVVDQHQENSPFAEGVGETMCIARPEDPGPQWDGCSGLLIHQGDYLPGNEMAPYAPDGPWGWHHNTDVAVCPAHPDAIDPLDGVQAPDGMDPIEQDFRPVGDKNANYTRWRAVCELSGFTFEPEAWYLPDSKVLVFDIFGHEETEAFLASFEFDG